MKPIHHSLISTEKRLITLFVWGAFLFLLIFEWFFIVSRILFENQFWRERFENEIQKIERGREGGRISEKRKWPMFPGMHSIIIEANGTIVSWQTSSLVHPEEIQELINEEHFVNLPIKTTQNRDGLLIYKSPLPNSNQFRIFIGKSGYPIDDILRDILRFLIMNWIILLPFYFMGRFFVRETLKPIGDNIDAMNHFIHDAGHELKTPLAIMSGNLQLLRDIKEKDTSLIEESIWTLHSMSDSLDGLLELSSLKLSKDIKWINITELIEMEIDKYKDQIEKKHLTLEKQIKKWSKITIDPKHFSLLFGNILKNAIIYNKDHWKIEITLENNTLSITDTGIGVNEKDLNHIWERFYRVDRSGKNHWSGIWLSIVDRIIKLYGWSVEVKSALWEWTTFVITTK